jgi:hypothetical protein
MTTARRPRFEHLPSNEIGGIGIAKLDPASMILSGRDVVPVNWRIAGNQPKFSVAAK